MDPDKAAKIRMARGTNTIGESNSLLSNNYEIIVRSETRITATGLLVVAELRPKQATLGLPSFLFRWDEQANHLNVDPTGVSEDQVRKFISGKMGYGGHLPIRSTLESRTFHTTISWDNTTIYEGDIVIPLKFEATVAVRIGVSVTASMELIRNCQTCGKKFKVQENETVCHDCLT